MTIIDVLSCLGGLEVNHHTAVPELRGSNPGYEKCFYVCFLVVVFLLFVETAYILSLNVAIPFAILFHLVYLPYCRICDQL